MSFWAWEAGIMLLPPSALSAAMTKREKSGAGLYRRVFLQRFRRALGGRGRAEQLQRKRSIRAKEESGGRGEGTEFPDQDQEEISREKAQ